MAKSSSSNGKSLVIVESPAKAKTINKYLGSGYEVKASMGHIRDLPPKGLNVDIENDFAPTYDIMPGKKRTVVSLKAAVKGCKTLYLATDLDREGEAIAWHLSQILRIPPERTYRVIFNAITGATIREAFANPGKLDMDKVMAQQARRILDRIVGYQISPLLWKKVAKGLSAGRVQSVAVKIIVEKEREIRAFVPQEYWLIPAIFTSDAADYSGEWRAFIETRPDGKNPPTVAQQNEWLARHRAFKAELVGVGDEKYHASDGRTANAILEAIRAASFHVEDIQCKQSQSNPSAPFITSTLQQAAANRLGFSTKRTMSVAQQLYEGIDLGSMGTLGLITYMRTDSTHVSGEALNEVRKHIAGNFGAVYMPEQPNSYAAGKSAQQAHEAIRPTDVDLTPEGIRHCLNEEQFKLYDLIWRRFVASQMTAARWDVTNLTIAAGTSRGVCRYKTTGRVQVFDGFARVWPVYTTEQPLPSLTVGQDVRTVDIHDEQHFTKPPARYTEASLVKVLEREGIGRPSTYASIISTIQERGYVEQRDKKFHATDLGEVVTDKLNDYFPQIMDVAFTRFMEEQLDKIEEQHLDWLGVLRDFYGPFKERLDKAQEQMKHARAEVTPSEYDCPDCGAKLVYRFGKNGRFLSCSTYPQCKFACPCDKDGKMVETLRSDQKCPQCGKNMVHKNSRFGSFLGCEDYPNCRGTLRLDKEGNALPPKPPAQPTGIKCHKCKEGEFVIRSSKRGPFLGCGRFPKCRTIVSIKQMDHLRELQTAGQWPPATAEEADALLGREDAKPRAKARTDTKPKTGKGGRKPSARATGQSRSGTTV